MQQKMLPQQQETSPEFTRHGRESEETGEAVEAQALQHAPSIATAAATTLQAPQSQVLLHQQQTPVAGPHTDTVGTGIGIALGDLVVGIPLSMGLTRLVAVQLSHPLPIRVSYGSVQQGMNFLLAVIMSVAVGYLVGKLAPRNGVRGLLIGRAIGFALTTLYTVSVLVTFASRGGGVFYDRVWHSYLANLPLALFWYAGIVLTEVLIARRVAGQPAWPLSLKISPSQPVSSYDRPNTAAGDSV